MLLWSYNKLVSSANKQNEIISEVLQISFIYIRNNKGPNIEPWGTPHEIYWSMEMAEL